jgi:hypothetical protein
MEEAEVLFTANFFVCGRAEFSTCARYASGAPALAASLSIKNPIGQEKTEKQIEKIGTQIDIDALRRYYHCYHMASLLGNNGTRRKPESLIDIKYD